jgi:glycosyltransferase involved in cell wall biosynthesis
MTMVGAFAESGADVTLLSSKSFLGKIISSLELAKYYRINSHFNHVTLNSIFFGLRFIEKLLQGIMAVFSGKVSQAEIIYTRNLNIVLPIVFFTNKPVFLETYKTLADNSILLRFWLRILRSQKSFKGIITHSTYAAESFIRFGFSKEMILVEHNSIDSDLFKAEISKKSAREILSLPIESFIVTYTGTVSLDKGLDLILEAAKDLVDVIFLIVGSKNGGEFENRAKNYSNIIVKPWVFTKDLIPYLYASDCLIIPPSEKPLKKIGNTVLPIKTFIYLKSGRPIIAPRTPDLLEILEHERNAILVNPGNIHDFVSAIQLLRSDKKFAEKIANQGKIEMEKSTWLDRATRILSFCKARL